MADLSSVLTPSVAPREAPPDDYQHIQANPSSFGGLIATGEEKAGAGVEQASNNLFSTAKFFGQVAADNASNDYQDFATKLLHGDPNKTGPDGQPDTGYLGLRGRAALDARPGVQKALDDQLESTRKTLTSPEQQLQFDNFSRRYRSMVEERVGSHADGQATTWYQGVNTASAKLALDHISLNADNPQEWRAGEADLAHAYAKTAMLNGARPPDPATGFPGDPQYQEAVANARKDALKARLDAIAVKNPSQAVAILDQPENKAIAGQYYDNMSSSYRGRANQQKGYDVTDTTIRQSYEKKPSLDPAMLTAAGAPYGISGAYLMGVHQMEGNGVSSTGAKGPFGFLDSTAEQYGLSNPFDAKESAIATAKKAADDKVALTASLGRPPTDAELYLAHNQGAGGAHSLLAHPNTPAGDLIPAYKIAANGGDPSAPAIAFTSMMTNKFNGVPVAATQSRKAWVLGQILANPDLEPDVRQHAIQHAEQQFAAQSIAEEQDSKAKKAVADQAKTDYTRRIVKGDLNGIIGQIADDPRLDGPAIKELWDLATTKGGIEDPQQYGPAYSDALKRILASPDDPSRINDLGEIVRMGARGELTHKGVGELESTMDKLKKQPDQAGITTVKSHQLDYYKSQFAIDQEMTLPGMKPYKNQKGLDRFNHDFVPAFESAYSQWVAKGKDPMEFLSDKKGMDEIADRVYPPSERAKDAIAAEGPKPADMSLPPVPEGLNKNTYESIVKHAPKTVDGTQWTPTAFGKVIDILRANPSPETRAAFNKRFGPAGFDADEILKKLPPLANSTTGQAKENLVAADAEMHLTPQEKSLYERHLTNLNGPGGVDNPDGSRSTLFQTTVEHDGKFYLIPTVYDGKILWDQNAPDHAAAAVEKAKQIGWDKFPSYKTEEQAEARYQQMHKFMEKDTATYLRARSKHAEAEPPNPAIAKVVSNNAVVPNPDEAEPANLPVAVGVRG